MPRKLNFVPSTWCCAHDAHHAQCLKRITLTHHITTRHAVLFYANLFLARSTRHSARAACSWHWYQCQCPLHQWFSHDRPEVYLALDTYAHCCHRTTARNIMLACQRYARAFNAQAADWTAHNLPGPANKEQGNYTWHTLDSGIRAGSTWPQAFFGFQNTADVLGSTRCAVVAGLAEHGRYLNLYASSGNANWKSMQYNGLGLIALALPELLHADEWYSNAEQAIIADMESGVYPDGVETEETSGYHKVALLNFVSQRDAVVKSGRVPNPLMSSIIVRMHGYLAYTLDAAGFSPLNSDSDTTFNAPFITAAAITYNRSDWAYIARYLALARFIHDIIAVASRCASCAPRGSELCGDVDCPC